MDTENLLHKHIIIYQMGGFGTSTINTNFLAVLEHQNKQIDYPVEYLNNAIKETRVKFHPQVLNTKYL